MRHDARRALVSGAFLLGAGLVAYAGGCQILEGLPDVVPAAADGGTGGQSATTSSSSTSTSSSTSSSTSTSSSSSSSSSSSGMPVICTPGNAMPCYDGPAGTEDAGVCMGGMATCNAQGTAYGTCMGEVTPKPPTCAGTVDVACLGHDNCVQWAEMPKNPSSAYAQGVAVDGAGNIYVSGIFSDTLQLQGVMLTAKGTTDAFLLKLDPKGAPLWGRSYGVKSAATGPVTVAVDASGNVAIGGAAAAAVAFGSYSAGPGIFVAKLDTNANVLWAQGLTASYMAPSFDVAYGVALTSQGNVVAGGHFSSSIKLGDSVVPGAGGAPAGTSYGFVALLNGSNGSGKSVDGGWGRALCAGTSSCDVDGVAVVAQDAIVVAGSMQKYVNVTPTVTLSHSSAEDYVFQVTSTGATSAWTAEIGASATCSGLTTDSLGRATVAGSGVIARYASDGTHLFNTTLTNAFGLEVAADGKGNVFVTGEFGGPLDLGLAGGPLMPTNALTNNLFVAKQASTQTFVWGKSYGNSVSNPSATGLAVTPQGDVVVVGNVEGAITFGTTLLTPGGQNDFFVLKLSQ